MVAEVVTELPTNTAIKVAVRIYLRVIRRGLVLSGLGGLVGGGELRD